MNSNVSQIIYIFQTVFLRYTFKLFLHQQHTCKNKFISWKGGTGGVRKVMFNFCTMYWSLLDRFTGTILRVQRKSFLQLAIQAS